MSFSLIFLISGCVSVKPTLNGFYQCTTTDGYHIQMSFDKENNSFILKGEIPHLQRSKMGM